MHQNHYSTVFFVFVILLFSATAISTPATAQEPQPGDACAAGQAGWYKRSSMATPTDGGNMLFCDGSNWQGFVIFKGDGKLGVWNSNPLVALDVGGTAKIANGGEACDGTLEGGLRYSSANIEYCDGSIWAELSGGSTPGGADREIQFNSGGSFSADSNFRYTADGDFVVEGTYTGTASVPSDIGSARMFFDAQTGAFRAGYASGTQWDNANIGNVSIAMGDGTIASGTGSIAMGRNSTSTASRSVAMGQDSDATGNYSTAIGRSNTASGLYGIAMGYNNTAAGNGSLALGREVIVTDPGDGSMAIGLNWTAAPATLPQVSGAESLGIFMGDQSGVDLSQARTMALMGGKLGIGTVAPNVELDVIGSIEYTGTISDMSDRRLKTDITGLPSGQLAKVLALDGISFRMKNTPDAPKELGFIAQDVQPYFPDLIYQRSDDGMLSMNYTGLIAPMVEAMKEQQDIIENQQKKIDDLEARLEALEAFIQK